MNDFHKKLRCYLLLGQSNMAGRGELSAVEPIVDPRILMFRNDNWTQAIEPLHQDHPEAGIGLAMSFSSVLLDHNPDITIGLIPCAVGATSISEWMPGTKLYQTAINSARKATDSLRGALWHQGEYDANDPNRVDAYAERLIFLIESIRVDLNSPQLPFITGELGSFINTRNGFPYGSDISAIQKSLGKIVQDYAFVSAAGLTDKGDRLHFNSKSLREFGKRYALELLRLWRK
ncbi:sialate O-acetylesterase [bacterium]|nr:sialate O-acetylesterase [bacterium]